MNYYPTILTSVFTRFSLKITSCSTNTLLPSGLILIHILPSALILILSECWICLHSFYYSISLCTIDSVGHSESYLSYFVSFTVRESCSSEDDIRLTLGTSNTFGRLEVCSADGYWGSVCGIGVSDTIADVTCRQLNHGSGSMYV